MNNERLVELKGLYNKLKELMSSPHLHVAFLKAFPNIQNVSPEKILELETVKFMLYISNSDGEITQREVNVMNYITEKYLSVDDLEELLADDFIEDMDDVPLTVKLMCSLENSLYRNGATLDSSLMNIFVTYFEALGIIISESDGYSSISEKSNINLYMKKMKEYISKNTFSPFFDY